MMFNDRRQPKFKNPAVGAAARAGSIKATSAPEKPSGPQKVPMENISKLGTRLFGVPTVKGKGKPKMVVPGSKQAAKLKAKIGRAHV